MIAALPIAWLQLSRQRGRFAASTCAVAFAVLLMFMEFGFLAALFDSSCAFHQTLNGDLFLINARSNSLLTMHQFSRRRLYQALSVPGVCSGSAVLLGQTSRRMLGQANGRRTMVVAVSPEQQVFCDAQTNAKLHALTERDVCIFDRRARKEFGPITQCVEHRQPVRLELNYHTIEPVALFSLGTSFGADGTIIVSENCFCRVFRNRRPQLIDIAALRVDSKFSLSRVQQQIAGLMPEIDVVTKAELMEREKNYWRQSTPIGFMFGVGVMLSLVVGAAIVYQILHAEINEHLSELATLKAMGYTDAYLTELVIKQAILLAVAGFIPGLLLATALYATTADATGLPLCMSLQRLVLVGSLDVLMCALSALLASHRLRQADPAEVF
jgi:putative ABC transport system permease protein